MKRELCWPLLLIPIAGLVILVVWWRRQRVEQRRATGAVVEFTVPIDDVETEPTLHATKNAEGLGTTPGTGSPAQARPEDLTKIEGIGPKIRQVLAKDGIVTFAHLAAAKVQELQRILGQAGIRLAYPDTWPEQAALAAKGDWAGLKALQEQLYRGRRV
jgi:predicted flap endonuclease-1-like 5' DNA nuclease